MSLTQESILESPRYVTIVRINNNYVLQAYSSFEQATVASVNGSIYEATGKSWVLEVERIDHWNPNDFFV